MTEIKNNHVPMRMCVACRKMHDGRNLIRVVNENGTAVLDTEKKHFGRGAYLCGREECIKKAYKKRILDKHLKCRVSDEIYRECGRIGEMKKG